MTTLTRIRNWQRRSVLRTLSVLAVVWLNVAFQACAMAYGAQDDCPHCPAGMHDTEMASMPMDCGLLDTIDDPDLLKPSVKASAGAGDAPLAVPASRLVPFDPVYLHFGVVPGRPVPSLHGPPPNVLFCVYLN